MERSEVKIGETYIWGLVGKYAGPTSTWQGQKVVVTGDDGWFFNAKLANDGEVGLVTAEELSPVPPNKVYVLVAFFLDAFANISGNTNFMASTDEAFLQAKADELNDSETKNLIWYHVQPLELVGE